MSIEMCINKYIYQTAIFIGTMLLYVGFDAVSFFKNMPRNTYVCPIVFGVFLIVMAFLGFLIDKWDARKGGV